MKYKALVIGCGNIGALYDLDTDSIITHAKAIYKRKLFELWLYDLDKVLVQKVANKYNAGILNDLAENELRKFDLISICTPTGLHYQYLIVLLNLNIKLIICEKPVSLNKTELLEIETCSKRSSSKVIVNYIRRFQPKYVFFKNNYSKYLNILEIQNVSIKYKRGFMNNASHALDLLEFLFEKEINLQEIKFSEKTNDVFADDPTVSLTAKWNNAAINLQGFTEIPGPLWEIELLFKNHKINFSNSGNDIILTSLKNGTYTEIFNSTDCIKDYMEPVIDAAINLLNNPAGIKTNFENSLALNNKMLDYIQ